MREIKFRIWDANGDNPQGKGLKGVMICNEFLIDHPRTFSIVLKGDLNIPYYLMQFIGLKDKNGKEIYEGDILRFEQKYNYSNGKNYFISPVAFHNGAFTIDILKSDLNTNGDYIHWGLCHDWSLGTSSIHNGDGTFEVIGNIHQNPELLTKKSPS